MIFVVSLLRIYVPIPSGGTGVTGLRTEAWQIVKEGTRKPRGASLGGHSALTLFIIAVGGALLFSTSSLSSLIFYHYFILKEGRHVIRAGRQPEIKFKLDGRVRFEFFTHLLSPSLLSEKGLFEDGQITKLVFQML